MKKLRCLFTLALLIACLVNLTPVHAQAGSAYDLIAEVNALRASQGLAAYTVDDSLMAAAQSQSEYMVSLGTWTHTRPDGSTAASLGIEENVAMGTDMSTSYCVYTVWVDWTHQNTMTGFTGGSVGAGVAFDGSTVYYTLDVIPSGGTVPVELPAGEQVSYTQPQQATATYFNTIITSTPNPDGSVIHIVKEGETLWSIAIAYGTTGAEIMTNTGNSPESKDVYAGQRLVIRLASPATQTPEPSPTA
ncbi:MAG: LysM peptidoglycan-binding domain-containing protein, partial [Anaerolineaceae bacterium]